MQEVWRQKHVHTLYSYEYTLRLHRQKHLLYRAGLGIFHTIALKLTGDCIPYDCTFGALIGDCISNNRTFNALILRSLFIK